MTKPPLTKLLPNLLPNPLPNQLPRRVTLREVGLRDGLQSIARVMPTAHKLEWIGRAYEAGQREIEVGSFVPARLLPQLADTAELVAFAKTLPALTVSVLVLNVKADTVGYADPAMVQSLFALALPIAGDKLNCGHFHDTRGMGVANVYAALQMGVTRFDACLAGIGGCPHAPGASGNVATEDLVYMFASVGVKTDIDFDALMALRSQVAHWLDGETLHGTLWRAGLPKTMRQALAAV